jgi:hypothetical protein
MDPATSIDQWCNAGGVVRPASEPLDYGIPKSEQVLHAKSGVPRVGAAVRGCGYGR